MRLTTVSEMPPLISEQAIDSLERRIRVLEKELLEKSAALQSERGKFQEASKAAIALQVKLTKTQRAEQKSALLHEAAKKRLAQALEFVGESQREIVRLKQLLADIGAIASQIEEKAKKNEVSLERQNLEKTYRTESERLLAVFRGVSAGISEMAQHEIESIRRWVPKRDKYLITEREKLIARPDAMSFITQVHGDSTQPMVISSVKRVRTARTATPASEDHTEDTRPATPLEVGVVGSLINV
jgi:hypothetical protein